MELRQLKTFRTVATLLSFNKAADVLNYAAVDDFGTGTGSGRGVGRQVIRPAGKASDADSGRRILTQYAQKMLDIEAATLSDLKGRNQPQGSLTIRAPQSIAGNYLSRVVAEFRTQFPGVSFDFHTCAGQSLEHELETGVTDLAFLLAESIHTAKLTAEPLRFERLLMVSNVDNPLSSKPRVWVRDLADQAIFLPKADCSYRMVLEQMLTEAGITPQTVLEFSTVEMLKDCLKSSQGVTMIPEITVRGEIDRNELSVLHWDEQPLETAVLMIWHKEKWLSPTLKAFMQIARAVIRDDALFGSQPSAESGDFAANTAT